MFKCNLMRLQDGHGDETGESHIQMTEVEGKWLIL